MKTKASPSSVGWSRRDFLWTAVAGALAPSWAVRAEEAAPEIRIGICRPWTDHGKLRSFGFDFCEDNVRRLLVPDKPDDAFASVVPAARGCGFPILSCNGFYPESIKLVGPKADHDRAVAWASVAARRAAQLGIPVLVLGSGAARRVPDGFSKTEAERQFIDLARRLGEAAWAHRVAISVESLNRKETNFLNTLAEVLEVVWEVNHPGFQAVADVYHMAREDEGPEVLRKAMDHVRHCHIAEKDKRTAPGTAGDDFRPFFKVLKEAGYRGGLSMECGWTDFNAQAADAVRLLRRQWAEA